MLLPMGTFTEQELEGADGHKNANDILSTSVNAPGTACSHMPTAGHLATAADMAKNDAAQVVSSHLKANRQSPLLLFI